GRTFFSKCSSADAENFGACPTASEAAKDDTRTTKGDSRRMTFLGVRGAGEGAARYLGLLRLVAGFFEAELDSLSGSSWGAGAGVASAGARMGCVAARTGAGEAGGEGAGWTGLGVVFTTGAGSGST